MKTTLTFLLLCLASLAACGLLGGDDHPDIPGKLVFAARDKNETFQIFTMNANGTHLKQLTHFDGSEGAYSPSWSPDGQQIIFSSFKNGSSDGPALWIMNADGSDMRVLYHPDSNQLPLPGKHARFSPDGSKIAFDLCLICSVATNVNIYVFDRETKTITQLTDHPDSEFNPVWSPDGSRIAFIAERNPDEYETDLYIMNADGSNVKKITKSGKIVAPIWHPNGTHITFRSILSPAGIYQIDLKTGDISLIKKEEKGFNFIPLEWSPDGDNLLYLAYNLDSPDNSIILFNINDKKMKFKYSHMPRIRDVDWYINEN